jgi:hypothetical protein
MLNCFSCGEVTGTDDTGGLVGSIYNCEFYHSFWDTMTSGQTVSAAGAGKTTEEMKMLATFTNVGWDFVGEEANGTGDVWRMCGDGISYPRLSWEFSSGGDMDCPDGVSMDDLLYLAGRWMKTTSTGAGAADADGNGKVDLNDFEILAANWMRM